jgi:hypothetical protein
MVEPFATHPELQGKRISTAMDDSGWPMFYERALTHSRSASWLYC